MSYIGASPTNVAFVTDTFTGNGSTTAFTMSVAPASTTSVLVAITGVLQDPSTYSVSGTTLTFSAAPPSGTNNISVRYLGIPASGVTTTAYRTVTNFTATAGQTTFSVPSYTVGYIDVYRNGSKLALADFTATNGTTVVLNNACNAGDVVETDSFYVSSVLNAIPATAGAVNSTYIANGAVGQTALAAGVAGNGPAFYVTVGTNQSLSASTVTKLQFNTKTFDTNSNYDTTLYRFTPTVAGYYQINLSEEFAPQTGVQNVSIYKNGARVASGGGYSANSGTYMSAVSTVIYLNGSTDYVEPYGYTNQAGTAYNGSSSQFSGALVRAA